MLKNYNNKMFKRCELLYIFGIGFAQYQWRYQPFDFFMKKGVGPS